MPVDFIPAEVDLNKRVRAEQMQTMEGSMVKALLGYSFGLAATCAIFYEKWGLLIILWGLATTCVCCFRFYLAYILSKASCQYFFHRSTHMLAIITVLLAISISSVPIWIGLNTDGFDSNYMMVAVVSVLWAGALVHITLYPLVIAFVSTIAATWLSCVLASGLTRDRLLLTFLFFLAVIVTLEVSRHMSNWLTVGLRQKIAFEHQTAVVSLLLKEHEEGSSDWLWQIDRAMKIDRPSRRFRQAFEHLAIDIDGRELTEIFPGGEETKLTLNLLREKLDANLSFRDIVISGRVNHEPRWWSISGRPIYDEKSVLVGFRGVMADVSIAHRAQSEVLHLAQHDALTDLPNRNYFLHRLETRLKKVEGGQLTVIGIDLDGFKPVNDRYGHFVGDALLIAVAERLQQEMSTHDLVARLGGDEFAIKTAITDPGEIEALCRRIVRTLSLPFNVGGQSVVIGASLGVSFAPTDGNTAEVLLKNADAALYRAKHEGRGTFRFFAADMDLALQERVLLLQDLKEALSNDQFVLQFQPFIDAGTGFVTGCEALIRWRHPKRGLLPPSEFIPLAEESGLIIPIGAWVIGAACAEAATWGECRRVAVNISPIQFNDPTLPDIIRYALEKAGLPPHRLEIELTETILVANANEALTMLNRIKALGVQLALDDFGTGYSSLSYLRSFPFDKIKIDRSFVRELDTQPESKVIIQAIQDIALGLHMTVTAEGVETSEQEALLRESGCQELQGYLYSLPRSTSELAHLRLSWMGRSEDNIPYRVDQIA